MFPPVIMQQTRLPVNRVSLRTAATVVALEGSIKIFIRSKMSRVASMIYFSSTRIISYGERKEEII
jgi:hypothetical protein